MGSRSQRYVLSLDESHFQGSVEAFLDCTGKRSQLALFHVTIPYNPCALIVTCGQYQKSFHYLDHRFRLIFRRLICMLLTLGRSHLFFAPSMAFLHFTMLTPILNNIFYQCPLKEIAVFQVWCKDIKWSQQIITYISTQICSSVPQNAKSHRSVHYVQINGEPECVHILHKWQHTIYVIL